MDDVGRAATSLSRRQQSVPDQANNGHLMDAKTARGFMQDQLMSLRPFAVAVDRNLMHAAEIADAQLGPALSFGRAYSEPVEKRGDAVVRQYASEFADQLHGLDVSLPAILPGAVLRHFKPRVISACQCSTRPSPLASTVTTISWRTARKIRLRVSVDAAGWFHN